MNLTDYFLLGLIACLGVLIGAEIAWHRAMRRLADTEAARHREWRRFASGPAELHNLPKGEAQPTRYRK